MQTICINKLDHQDHPDHIDDLDTTNNDKRRQTMTNNNCKQRQTTTNDKQRQTTNDKQRLRQSTAKISESESSINSQICLGHLVLFYCGSRKLFAQLIGGNHLLTDFQSEYVLNGHLLTIF